MLVKALAMVHGRRGGFNAFDWKLDTNFHLHPGRLDRAQTNDYFNESHCVVVLCWEPLDLEEITLTVI